MCLQDMSGGGEPFPPYGFLLALRDQFPQFAQQGRDGMYSQQDAEECWTNVLYSLREKVKVRSVRQGNKQAEYKCRSCACLGSVVAATKHVVRRACCRTEKQHSPQWSSCSASAPSCSSSARRAASSKRWARVATLRMQHRNAKPLGPQHQPLKAPGIHLVVLRPVACVQLVPDVRVCECA